MKIDWYDRRYDLNQEDIFFDCEGNLIKLDKCVPGDGTKWYCAVWSGGSWSYEDDTIEPAELRYKVNTI
jgi:hypothetical protein